eukprot:2586737-Prorocentrum_lima.AAC.1
MFSREPHITSGIPLRGIFHPQRSKDLGGRPKFSATMYRNVLEGASSGSSMCRVSSMPVLLRR